MRNKPCVAISYDSATYHDLKTYLKHDCNIDLMKFTPEEFFRLPVSFFHDPSTRGYQYINLISQDFELREKICRHLDTNQADRFSYVHPSSTVVGATVGQGVFVYPNCVIYPSANVGNDVVIHGQTLIAHQAVIGQGTYISGKVVVAGGTSIGAYCQLGLDATVFDKITIVDHVLIGACSIVKKSILQSGTWATVFNKRTQKLK